MDIIVKCGNGGDYEWYYEQYQWQIWIKHNVPGAKFTIGWVPQCKADEICIAFEHPPHATLFNLKRPFYISYEDISSIPVDTP